MYRRLNPDREAGGKGLHASRSQAGLSREDKKNIFKSMVVSELEAGFLRYSRRQKLMRYANQLSIPEFEAALLIAEAQFYSDEIVPVDFDTTATLKNVTRPESWSVSLRLSCAIVSAALIDLILICWFFG